MKTVLIDGLLVVAVASLWLTAIAFARLKTPLDRLHCIAFANIVGGGALMLAAFVADGLAIRPAKILFILLVNLLAGAAMSHALGRTATYRGEKP
jgi:multicomponent Na+:H+ antiporter subunit G